MANMTFKANLLPNTNLGYSLGSSDLKWKINDAYVFPMYYTNIDYSSTSVEAGAFTLNGQQHPVTGITEYGSALTLPAYNNNATGYNAQIIVSSAAGQAAPAHMYIRRLTAADGWSNWSTILDNNNYSTYLDSRYVNITGDTMTGRLYLTSIASTGNDHTGIISITNDSTINNGGYFSSIAAMAPNVGSSQHLFMVGTARSSKNSAYYGFHYDSAGSNDNYATMGLYGVDQIINIKGNGNVGIGTVDATHKLTVNGNITGNTIISTNTTTNGSQFGMRFSDKNNGIYGLMWTSRDANKGGFITFRHYAENSSGSLSGYFENFRLPSVTAGLSSNPTYNILTSKDWTSYVKYIEGTNDAANPGGALLRSGSGRSDASPAGDTWIYWDTLGGTTNYWGIRHNQAANTIGFYGGGNERVLIHLGESKVTATTFAGNATTASKWQTARTLTIGNTGKSVDGSANVSWSKAEIIGSGSTANYLRGDHTWTNSLTGTYISTASPGFQNNTSTGTWCYVRLHNGSNFWDIATRSDQNGGCLDFRPGGSANMGPRIYSTGLLTVDNIGETTTGTYGEAAMQIREYRYGGAQTDTWGHAPRLTWHWSGRVAAQIGLASNGYLYEAPVTGTNFYKIVIADGSTYNITATPASHQHNINDIKWPASHNLVCTGTSTEWSIDMQASATGSYWHVWSGVNSASCLQCFNDDRHSWAYKLYGAVWNDYAEYRQTKENIEPGRCIKEVGDDTLILTTQRLERGCEIVSDTFGMAIGKSQKNNTPTAASGRVLAYPYEDREEFRKHIGWPVCSGPNGTVSIMTEEEEEKYSSRIIGTISAVPDYEEWLCGDENKPDIIKVNGRVWIRIR